MLSLGYNDFSTNTTALNPAIVHRLHEDWWNNEFAAVTRFDVVIDLKGSARRSPEENYAIFADVDVIDSTDG